MKIKIFSEQLAVNSKQYPILCSLFTVHCLLIEAQQ